MIVKPVAKHPTYHHLYCTTPSERRADPASVQHPQRPATSLLHDSTAPPPRLATVSPPLFQTTPPTPLTPPGERLFVPFPSVPLSFIKALKDAAGRGFTVNDVLLAVTSGVLRRHCELVGDEFLRKGGEVRVVRS